jgi:glycosyltransferase involved in cell wall biosynthesis
MRIFCIYPGLNKEVNDVAQLIIYLKRSGNDVCVVTARSGSRDKGIAESQTHEIMDGVSVYRLYDSFDQMIWLPNIFFHRVLKVAQQFRPDVIFCSQQNNMRIAVGLKKRLRIPLVLLVETASDVVSGRSGGKASHFLWQAFGIPYGRSYWRWLSKWSEAIITCNPNDQGILDKLSVLETPVHYVPWCTQLPEDFSPAEERVPDRAVYVGGFSKFKNTEEFRKTIPIVMTKTATKEFVLVGSGDIEVIEALKKRYGSTVKHVVHMSRKQALELLTSCAYGYTPVKKGGWGFIGECWATKTPLVMTHSEYCAQNLIDSVVVSPEQIDTGISLILNDTGFCKNLQENGYGHYLREHSAAAVGRRLIDVFESVSDSNPRLTGHD